MKKIVLGGGCFWCVEAVYQRVDGVTNVESGYAGGHVDNPDYYDVCRGTTGHAEVVRIDYDETKVSLGELLSVFFATHDPTTLNRQGNDRGTQYRSVIFYDDMEEKTEIERVIKAVAPGFDSEIVTQIVPSETFWPAEIDHQDYYNNNSQQPYCQFVVKDKLDKLQKYLAQK